MDPIYPKHLADWIRNLLTPAPEPTPTHPHPYGNPSLTPMGEPSAYLKSLIHGAEPDYVPTHKGVTGAVGYQKADPYGAAFAPRVPLHGPTTENDSPLEGVLRDGIVGRGGPGAVAGMTPLGLVQQGAGLAGAALDPRFHASEMAKQLGMIGIGALIHHKLQSDMGEIPLMTPRPQEEAAARFAREAAATREANIGAVSEPAVASYGSSAPSVSPFAFDNAQLTMPMGRSLHGSRVPTTGLLDAPYTPANFPFTTQEPLENVTGKRFAILTAENPNGQPLDAASNAARNAKLEAQLRARGHDPIPVKGAYTDEKTGQLLHENSFLVPHMSPSEAIEHGRAFDQNSVITHQGSHSTVTGQLSPSSGITEGVTDSPYSELPDGRRFRSNIDWSNPLPKNANPDILDIVSQLNQGTKMPRVTAVDPAKASLMSRVYDSLPVNDPVARESYDALNKEVAQQYKALQDAGYNFQYVDKDPYKNSTAMMKDVRNNKTLKVLKTPDDNFHPYMTPEQNNQFRAVHDAIAHAGEGNQFGPVGEENAFRVHASTLTPGAQQALATETRGQNSWVNYGPKSRRLEDIGQAALKLPDGRVVTGASHLDAALQAGFPYGDVPKGTVDGWTTRDSNQFVTREQADDLDSSHFNPDRPPQVEVPTPANERPFAVQKAALWPKEWLGDYHEMPDTFEGGAGPSGSAPTAPDAPPSAPTVVTTPSSGSVFDESKLGTNVPNGVTTTRPPVQYPPRAVLPASDLMTRRFNSVYTPNALRALKDTPEAAGWYDMSQMRDAMASLSPTGADDFHKFAMFMGPTSTGTTVPQNIKQASAFYHLWKQGLLNESDLRDGTVQMPQGFANRRQASVNSGILRILQNGSLDPYATPKTYRYSNAIAGQDWGGAALDMHVGRQVGPQGLLTTPDGDKIPARGFPTGGYDQTGDVLSSPKPHVYPLIEDKLIHQSDKLSLPPTMYQALGWVGGGQQTGVADPRSLLALMNERFRITGQKLGISPLDAFRQFAKGATPLYGIGAGLLSLGGASAQDSTAKQ